MPRSVSLRAVDPAGSFPRRRTAAAVRVMVAPLSYDP